MSKPDILFDDMNEMFEWMGTNVSYFGEDAPFDFNYTNNDSPLTIVTGDNASGKSFIRKMVQSMCSMKQPKKIECIHLSQNGRCTEGVMRSFVYGSEVDESTGRNTVQTLLTSMTTSHNRETPHLIVYDEPEIGLSDEYSAGIGIRLREFINDKPELLFGVVIITHNQHLIKELLEINPDHLNLSNDKTLTDIANREIVPNRDLEGLIEKSRKSYREILDIQYDR